MIYNDMHICHNIARVHYPQYTQMIGQGG